ncbi:MAG: hypothetical protein JWP99_996, partial [Devosia sp.]|nr:hypothetical protein [Devosia sp.]
MAFERVQGERQGNGPVRERARIGAGSLFTRPTLVGRFGPIGTVVGFHLVLAALGKSLFLADDIEPVAVCTCGYFHSHAVKPSWSSHLWFASAPGHD